VQPLFFLKSDLLQVIVFVFGDLKFFGSFLLKFLLNKKVVKRFFFATDSPDK